MKLPKTLTVAGYEWEIRRGKGHGACFDAVEHWIDVGTSGTDDQQWEWFIHELCEGILSDNLLRYRKPHTPAENGDYMFVFDHSEFELLFAKPLSQALWEIIP